MLLHATVLVHCMNGAATQGERIPQYPSGLYKMKVKVARSCLTLCNPMDCTVHRILQARILEWVAIPFFRGSFQPRDQTQVFHIAGGFFTSWATRETQEYWSGRRQFGVVKKATLWEKCWGDKRDTVRETESERSRVQSPAEYWSLEECKETLWS